MAQHPYNQHREQQVAHRRVDVVLKGSPSGAKQHGTGHAFSKLTSKSAAVRDDEVAGRSAPKRFARGGKVKGHTTNIIIATPGAKGPGAGPGGPPPGPMGGPPPPPMPGGPGMPPPGMPPGMPMRARGGKISGLATKENLKQWAGRAKDNSYARGGAASGVGREEKANRMKRK